MSPPKPTTALAATAVSALTMITVLERTPEIRGRPDGTSTTTAPVSRRDEPMDEAHEETSADALNAKQGMEQGNGPAATTTPAPMAQKGWQFPTDDDATGWRATQQSIANARRANFLLVLQARPVPEQDETHADNDAAGIGRVQGVEQSPPPMLPSGRGIVDDAAYQRRRLVDDWQPPRNAALLDLPS